MNYSKKLVFFVLVFASVLLHCEVDFFNWTTKGDITFRQPVNIPGNIDTSYIQNFPQLYSGGGVVGIVDLPNPSYPVYGLYGWYSYYSDWWHLYEKVNDVGWKVVRVGGPENVTNEVMTNLMDNGYEVLFTIMSDRWDAPSNYVAGDDIATTNNFIAGFRSRTTELLNKFGPGGSFWLTYPSGDQSSRIYWEIWNEPNLHYLYQNPDNWVTRTMEEKAVLYGDLLVSAYVHITANWPGAKVVGFSACGVSRNDVWSADTPGNTGFIELVHQHVLSEYGATRAKNFYHILSNHPYVHDAPPDSENIRNEWFNYSIANSHAIYREIMDRSEYNNGTKKEVWFTEIGWHRYNGAFPSEVNYPVSERIQAAYVCRMYMTALRLGVRRVHIMFMFDADRFNGGFFNYVSSSEPDNITWNENAYAVQTMINIMPRPKIVDAISDGTEGYYAYIMDSDYSTGAVEQVIVAWNVAGTINVTIPLTAGTYIVYNMIGGYETVTVTEASMDVEIGPCPIYIVPQL